MFTYDVTLPESPAVANIIPPEAEDDDSDLLSMTTTTLELSDDEMSTDGDSVMETKDAEQLREPMRSEGC